MRLEVQQQPQHASPMHYYYCLPTVLSQKPAPPLLSGSLSCPNAAEGVTASACLPAGSLSANGRASGVSVANHLQELVDDPQHQPAQTPLESLQATAYSYSLANSRRFTPTLCTYRPTTATSKGKRKDHCAFTPMRTKSLPLVPLPSSDRGVDDHHQEENGKRACMRHFDIERPSSSSSSMSCRWFGVTNNLLVAATKENHNGSTPQQEHDQHQAIQSVTISSGSHSVFERLRERSATFDIGSSHRLSSHLTMGIPKERRSSSLTSGLRGDFIPLLPPKDDETPLTKSQQSTKKPRDPVSKVIEGQQDKKKKFVPKKCDFPMCTNSSRSRGFCYSHGGGRRCRVDGCPNGAVSRDLCKRHGGGRRCAIAGCKSSSESGGLCYSHGGGKRCRVHGCTTRAKKEGLCAQHYECADAIREEEKNAQEQLDSRYSVEHLLNKNEQDDDIQTNAPHVRPTRSLSIASLLN